MSTKPEDESSGADTTSRTTELPPVTPAGAASRTEKQGTLRRRTRAGRALFRDELTRRREKKLEERPPVVVTESTTPEDLGMPRLIDFPSEGIPEIVDDEHGLSEAALALRNGSGPVAIDAERASGYRYGQRAYLVQLRREGAGSFLIDPIACPDLTPLSSTLSEAEWVLHAATQDLPCLAELGIRPSRLFDTELGARLAGQPRVGLAAVLEHYLGVTLAKEHSAVDWSTRPLPEPWLRYAVLDVEVLVDLRDAVETDLHAQGKSVWAEQEFHALTSFAGPVRRVDPWRRLSGLHKIRDRRTMAIARELWFARDDVARSRDISPSRVIPDSALLDIAHATPKSLSEVGTSTTNRAARRHASAWLAAVTAGREIPEDQLPPLALPSDAPPPQRAWTDRAPDAAARLAAVREQLQAFGVRHSVPVENVLTPDTLRRVLWSPPEATEKAVGAALAARGARSWQIDIVAPMIVDSLKAD
ncbi:HRDC domain-containing protein [Austwickia chelonae]|uniref:HRDC domain-containing protein n=1 Tax=Austwickia chelonae TaxID=100225 RepID=UPI001F083A12|nr:HRDC domain-containing protein [Austwickia chelonae]